MIDVCLDAVLDTLKLLPFLFLTYLVMEYLEHKTGEKAEKMIKKAGYFGPFIGSLLGAFPQCGFSAAASNLYAGRVITLGSLLAIYLSTSDEMLPILISEKAPAKTIGLILLGKILTGMIVGVAVDAIVRKFGKQEHEHIHEICEHDHCHCEQGIIKSALHHTVQIAFYIFLIGLVLNTLLHFVGEDVLGSIILNRPVLGPVLASLVGLVPNCAGSVVITQLYLTNVISPGAAFAGLLTGSGVGLLILFRVNHDRKENVRILALLYGIGVVVGIALELMLRAIA
ncbi:MAG: putative manganese transporter [Acetatifactor sp.]